MIMTFDKLAKKTWEKIRSQLEDRSVLELGSGDKDTEKELEDEQIKTILDALMPAKRYRGS